MSEIVYFGSSKKELHDVANGRPRFPHLAWASTAYAAAAESRKTDRARGDAVRADLT